MLDKQMVIKRVVATQGYKKSFPYIFKPPESNFSDLIFIQAAEKVPRTQTEMHFSASDKHDIAHLWEKISANIDHLGEEAMER